MKKLLLILLLMPLLNYSQQTFTGSVTLASFTTDTTIFIPFKAELGSAIEFDFTNFSNNTCTLDFGFSNTTTSFESIDDSRNPFTLNKTVYTKTVNGVAKSRLLFIKDKWNAKYIAIKLTRVSSGTGTFTWTWVR
jgi:hypothetical protein